MKIFGITLVLLFLATVGFAHEEEIPLYRGIRSMGMGGIVTTTGDYAEALFGNPARHSEVEHSKFSLIDLTVSANSNLVTGVKSAKSFSGGSGSSTITKATDLIGKNQYARMDFLIGYYNPHFLGDLGFAAGMLVSTQATLLLHYTTDINAQLVNNVGPNVGVSHRFFQDKLSLGANIHTLYRVAADDRLSSLDFLSGSKGLKLKDIAHQGMGVDLDFGGYYFVPWKLNEVKMGIGASLNNIMKSHYRNFNPNYIKGLGQNPPGNARLLNTGVRLDFNDIWIFREPLFAFEFNNLGATTKRYSTFKRIHFGGETKVSRLFILRTGVNQGYLCGGFGLDLPLLKIDIATYGQELAGNAGTLQDRRYMFRLALEI